MKILVAEDDRVSRLLLETHLKRWGHEPVGAKAWDVLQREGAPRLAILGWMMPGLDGVEVCRRARGRTAVRPLYITLLTARADRQDAIDGLGADDYVTKPFDAAELRARVNVGVRVVELQVELAARIADLEEARARGPASRDPAHLLVLQQGAERQRFLAAGGGVRERPFRRPLQPRVCPECVKTVLQPELDELRQARASRANLSP